MAAPSLGTYVEVVIFLSAGCFVFARSDGPEVRTSLLFTRRPSRQPIPTSFAREPARRTSTRLATTGESRVLKVNRNVETTRKNLVVGHDGDIFDVGEERFGQEGLELPKQPVAEAPFSLETSLR